MKYRTVVEREGELLGPIDWDYNFRSHFDGYCCSEEWKDQKCNRTLELLRKIEAEPGAFRVLFDNGYFERDVVSLGMYDGWPFWKPTPALLTSGVLGCEWHFFYEIQKIDRKPSAESEEVK